MTQRRGAGRTAAVPLDEGAIERAAEAIAAADGLVIAAGAGMGVDSGLPDFRGREGFWRAYPKLAAMRIDFESIANPAWFDEDPELAWGFYGHRLNLYRKTEPHAGFALLARWARRMAHGAFVYTSNVDGQFQKAGFAAERIAEVHGSIHHLQCHDRCGARIFEAPPGRVELEEVELRARPPLPRCPRCGRLARPNILMFDDFDWDGARSSAQRLRFNGWLRLVRRERLVVVECGAGGAIATVRRASEKLADEGATLVRINPREPMVPEGQVSIAMGALEALSAIDARLTKGGRADE